jgi:phosphoglycerate dehydrogenase-like enzyme
MSVKPKILVLPQPGLYTELFSPAADAQLHGLGDVTRNSESRNWDSDELASKIGEYDIIMTGWGTSRFTDEVLAAAPNLKLIAHTAGSIKHMLPPPVFARGIAVTHAAGAIAPAVAELTILLILLSLRQVHKLDAMLKRGEPWDTVKNAVVGREIAGQRVGVVGAGYTGRQVIRLLQGLGAEVWVYDPYLDTERAAALGVHHSALDDIFAQCPIVTLQAPPTKETYHMVGAKQLALLQDGAVFINTARSHLVDEEALLAELRKGRFQAALDVFDQEPLPEDSPFRTLDNIVITPHVAGHSAQARRRQGQEMVNEIARFLAGEPLHYPVTVEMLEIMA